MENKKSEKTFLELLYYLRGKVLIILSVVIACTLISFLVSKFAITPKYTAVSSIYILNRSNNEYINNSDFQTSTELLNDYKALIRGKSVTSKVIEQLNLDMSPSELSSNVEVTSEKNTRVLLIKVTDTDKERATLVANTIWQVAEDQLKSIMDVEAVNLVYEASVPTAPTSPNIVTNSVMGFLVGLVAMILIYTCVFMLDNRIKTEEEVESYLGLNTMGVIPYYEPIDKDSTNKFNLSKIRKLGRSHYGKNTSK